MKGIFHPDRRFWEEEPWPSVQEIRNLDLKEDRCYLEYMVQYARGSHLNRLMKKLGISELPEKTRNLEDPSDRDYEEYFVLEEQVAREPDAEILKEAAYEASTQMAKFAFCRLTKYSYPSPWNDAYSYRTYECGWKEGMTTEDVIEFCREMIAVQGPFAREAEEAAGILRRLIKEGPEEKLYREQLQKAEAVFRKAVKETALQTGFTDAESPIVIYHSLEPKYAEVFCRLLEERFRGRGGTREIAFRWQESAPHAWEAYAEAQRRPQIRWQESGCPTCEVKDDTQHQIGDICCCDLPTMIKLYYTTGNLTEISPFIDTDDIFPDLLEQCRIEWEVCGVPVLMFAGNAAGSQAFFAFMNHSYGFKRLDCLDLMMLMTNSDFLSDVCMACNEGDTVPHVFPANRKAYAHVNEKFT